MELNKCRICGKVIDNDARLHYCSEGCREIGNRMMNRKHNQQQKERRQAMKENREIPKDRKVCPQCGKVFFTYSKKAWCSKSCYSKYYNKNQIPKEELKPKKSDRKTLEKMTPNQLLDYGKRSREVQLKALHEQMESDRKLRELERIAAGR